MSLLTLLRGYISASGTTSAEVDIYIVVTLTLKAKADGSSTTIKLTNRPLKESGTSTFYYPLLLDITGLSQAMGDYLPAQQTGNITINNSPGSLGVERRFSDLLQKYAIIDQAVTISSAYVPFGATSISSYLTQNMTGTVRAINTDSINGKLVISVTGAPVPQVEVTKIIDSVSFPNAPDQSLGQYIPIVFGEDQLIVPIRVDADADESPSYAYGTTFGTTYPNGGINAYYAKDSEGNYKNVHSASAVSTAVFSESHTPNDTTFLDGVKGLGWDIGYLQGYTNYILTQGKIKAEPLNTTPYNLNSQMIFSIYELDKSGTVPLKEVGRAEVDKSDYGTEIRGSADFWIEFTFKEPVFLSSSNGYAMVYTQSVDEAQNSGAGDTFDQFRSYQSGSTKNYFLFYETPAGAFTNGSEWIADTNLNNSIPIFELYGIKLTDTTAGSVNSAGLGHSSFEATQKTATSLTTNPDITKIDYLLKVDGLQDSSSGTITGTNNLRLTNPRHQIALLERVYSGGTWSAGAFDFSLMSDTHAPINGTTHRYSRATTGYTIGRQTFESLAAEICRSGAARIAPVNSSTGGKYLGLYGWGTTIASSATFTAEDCVIDTWEIRDTRTVVNYIKANYGRKFQEIYGLRNMSLSLTAPVVNNGVVLLYNGSSTLGTDYFSVSETTYGRHELANAELPFIANSTSAEHWAEYIATRYAEPTVFVKLRCFLQPYQSLKIMDVVTVVHPDLPAYFGTNIQQFGRMAHYEGTEADPTLGFPLSRAEPYRAQIEAREIAYNFNGVPELILTVRLLLNTKDPT